GVGIVPLFSSTVLASGYDYYYTTAANPKEFGFLTAGLLIYFLCICLIPLVIGAILAVVVYKDAKKNNVENPILWAILTFLFSIIGLLVYFLAIRPEAIRRNSGLSGAINKAKDVVSDKVEEV